MANLYKNRRLISGSTGTVLPTGSTANRPGNPVFGLIRFNTDTGLLEYFDGVEYVSLNIGAQAYVVDDFVGNGVTTTFTMTVPVASATQVMVYVGSLYQQAVTSYTVSGGLDIVFSEAPPAGVPINAIHAI
jgi:hypothetical protein